MRLLEWFTSLGGIVEHLDSTSITLFFNGYTFEYHIHRPSIDESIEEAIKLCVAGILKDIK